MSKLKTQEEFIACAIKVHGDKYTYEQVVYVKSAHKVTVTCKKHGPFNITGMKLLYGQGCRTCGQERSKQGSIKSQEQFLVDAARVHGDAYTYEPTVYKSCYSKVTVRCAAHGDFEIKPSDFLNDKGCKECGEESRRSKRLDDIDDFITKSKAAHGDKYDYTDTMYVDSNTKVDIRCRKHGVFSVGPSSHKQGAGCMQCGREATKEKQRGTLAQFAEKADTIHNGAYDYSLIDNFTNDYTKVGIRCKKHDTIFQQSPSNHKAGKGCPLCQPGGYTALLPGSFYILTSDKYIKVGVTNKLVKNRARKISSSSGIDFAVHTDFRSQDGSLPALLEKTTLAFLRQNYKSATERFDGYTECFLGVTPDEITAFYTKILEEVHHEC